MAKGSLSIAGNVFWRIAPESASRIQPDERFSRYFYKEFTHSRSYQLKNKISDNQYKIGLTDFELACNSLITSNSSGFALPQHRHHMRSEKQFSLRPPREIHGGYHPDGRLDETHVYTAELISYAITNLISGDFC
jgi:hypothetical protein